MLNLPPRAPSRLSRHPTRSLPEPLLDGNALVAEGMRPGPRFKVLLDLAMDAQIEGRIASRADALQLVRAADRTG